MNSDHSANQSQLRAGITEKHVVLIVLLFTVLGVVLRLYRLDEGLWLDEITTYLKYARLPFMEIVTKFDSENQHFLFSILAHCSIQLFGDNAWALRLPAVLFGTGSIIASYLVGREVTDIPEALLATALVAFSYHQIWFSQNARGYTGLLFWTLMSSWLLIRGFKDNRTGWWVGYAVAAALGMYTHLTMGFIILGQFLTYWLHLWDIRQNLLKGKYKPLFIGFGGAGLLTLLLYLPVVGDIRGAMSRTMTGVAEMWTSPLWTLRELFLGLSIGYSQGAVVLAALVVFLIGVVDYFRTRRIVVELLLFGPIIGALATISLSHPLWPRFFFFAFGFVSLVVVRGTIRTVQWICKLLKINLNTSRWLQLAAGILLVVISAASVPFAYGPKQDFSGAREYIEQNLQPGDRVVTVNLTVVPYSQYYLTDWTPVDSLAALDQVLDQSTRTWVVYTFPQVLEVVQPDIIATLKEEYKVEREFGGTLSGGTIYLVVANHDGVTNTEGQGSP